MSAQLKSKKVATKGAKQIVEENAETLRFYRNMAAGTAALNIVLNTFVFPFVWFEIIMSVMSVGMLLGAYQFMLFMTKATYGEKGELLDSGSDLNTEGGTAEHVKDFIILICGTILLATTTDWFWLMLLMIPGRIFFGLWGSVIKPYLFGSDDDQQPNQALDDKKQRKLDRKMKKMR